MTEPRPGTLDFVVRQNAQAEAIVDGELRWTYDEWDARACRLGSFLRDRICNRLRGTRCRCHGIRSGLLGSASDILGLAAQGLAHFLADARRLFRNRHVASFVCTQ